MLRKVRIAITPNDAYEIISLRRYYPLPRTSGPACISGLHERLNDSVPFNSTNLARRKTVVYCISEAYSGTVDEPGAPFIAIRADAQPLPVRPG
jgi:hypothetical protein